LVANGSEVGASVAVGSEVGEEVAVGSEVGEEVVVGRAVGTGVGYEVVGNAVGVNVVGKPVGAKVAHVSGPEVAGLVVIVSRALIPRLVEICPPTVFRTTE